MASNRGSDECPLPTRCDRQSTPSNSKDCVLLVAVGSFASPNGAHRPACPAASIEIGLPQHTYLSQINASVPFFFASFVLIEY